MLDLTLKFIALAPIWYSAYVIVAGLIECRRADNGEVPRE